MLHHKKNEEKKRMLTPWRS